MRRTSIIAAAFGGLVVASSSFAGFTVSATKTSVSGFDRYDVVAINTGGDTGVQIKGLEYFYNGSPAAFQVDDTDEDGTVDTVNLLSSTRTRIRVSTTGANNVFVGVSPTNGAAQPNPYAAGASAFQGAIANTGTTNASGTGFQIARIFLPVGGTGVLSGNLGGDIGSKVPFSVSLGGGPGPTTVNPVIVNNNASTNVVFGAIVTNGAPFSIVINATDADAGDVLSLTAGAVAGLTNVTVTPSSSTSPAAFTVAGTVDYSLNGTTVNVPITVNSTSGSATGSFSIVVTPEPASLGLIGLSSLFLGRRRK